MGEELIHALEPQVVIPLKVFGIDLSITDTILVMWVIMAFLIISVLILTRNMKTVPEGKQNFVEMVVDLINSIARNNIGHHWEMFAPYLGTVLLFLLFANTISIFNIIPSPEQLYHMTGWEFFEHIPEFSLRPPTRDFMMTSTLAVITILVVLSAGIRVKKTKGFLKSFIEPMPIVLPFKIMDYFVRPLSLCFRLFGNILGAFVVMELIYSSLPVLFPAALSIYFDLFDGGLQAYVFVFLTSLYIAEAIE